MLRNAVKATLAFSLLLICSVARADVYVLGSSYSNDALPWALGDQPQWHIDCGRPLQYIFDNPLAPCDVTSTIWPVALALTQFDSISFQPVAGVGITQQSDIDTISFWLAMQPAALGVIHPTWPTPGQWEAEFHNAEADHTLTNYSQQYAHDLIDKLREANPERTFVSDQVNEIFDSIYHDIENGIGPLIAFEELFRDEAGHLGVYGHYVAHNGLRQAFGQRTGIDHSAVPIPKRIRKYLDVKIRSVARGVGRIESGGRVFPSVRRDER